MAAPKLFISYSHDSDTHKAWVLRLATDLRASGVDVVLDQWDLSPGQDLSLFMQKGISSADRVLLVCSKNYVKKADSGTGGVGYERLIVTTEVVRSIDTLKFIPIVRNNDDTTVTPTFLGPRLFIDFRDDVGFTEKLDALLREIHGAPIIAKPPLGTNPFSGRLPHASSGMATELRDTSLLQNEWFSQEATNAHQGLKKSLLPGSMEVRFGLVKPLVKSQIELLNGVRQSEIQTFGWPIGITLETKDEYRPHPYEDGIKAEIAIDDGSTGRQSYDYWSLRSNGDFFLLQSLFEDSRRSGEIFFDTRIVRVTECLMFAERLYNKLGAPPDSRINIQITHRGLNNRTLTSASPDRPVFPRASRANISSSQFVCVLQEMERSRVMDAKKVLEPLFMLFDFMQFADEVYEEIVRNFEAGRIK